MLNGRTLFLDDRLFLVEARQEIERYLTTLRLRIHPIKSQLFETRIGASFVGFQVLPIGETFPKAIRVRVRNDNLRRSRKRLRILKAAYGNGEIDLQRLSHSVHS